MATRGRKPKPTALKLLEGNPGNRPLNIAEPRPTGVPDCPDWLEDEAKAEWERMSTVLENMGMLTDMDMVAFAGYCQAYARWKEAEEFLSQHGSIVRMLWSSIFVTLVAKKYHDLVGYAATRTSCGVA